MHNLTLAALALATVPVGSVPTGTVPAAIAGRLDGAWGGGMAVPAGLTIPFAFDISGSGGTFSAPDQNVKGIPIAITTNGSHVVVTLHGGQSRFEGEISADGSKMQGQWLQGANAFPASFARGAPLQEVKRPQTPTGPFPYSIRDVTMPGGADGVTLAGTLTIPKAIAPVGAVLFIGGNGPQNRDEAYAGHRPFLLLADRLTRAGVAVLRYDKRGVGNSTGSYARAEGLDFVADAAAALDWLWRQPGIDPTHVGVIGLSEGSEIAPIVAANPGSHVAFVVLLSAPGVRGDHLMAEQARAESIAGGATPEAANREADLRLSMLKILEASDADRPTARDQMTAAAIKAGHSPSGAAALTDELSAPDATTFLTHDPSVSIGALRQPVLVVAGSLDQQVPPSINLPPIRSALVHDRSAEIVLIPGLNHLLQPAKTGLPNEYSMIDVTMDARVLDLVERFVRREAMPAGK